MATLKYIDGSVYRGDVQNGKPHGTGTLTYANGNQYSGEWRDGQKHGYGTFSFPSGARYQGQYVMGKRSGWGEYYYANGDRFSGEFRDGVANGSGTFTAKNGDVWNGTWKDGKRHGTFSYTPKYGRSTTEEYFEDRKLDRYSSSYDRAPTPSSPRYTTPIPPQSSSYSGYDLKKRSGKKDLYSGPKKNGLPHTGIGEIGLCEYEGGEYYNGEWKDGAPCGRGSMTYKKRSGEIYYGEWKDGLFHGEGTLEYSTGGSYTGGFAYGRQNGKGTHVIKKVGTKLGKEVYTGEWKDGKRHGYGECKYANGSRYKGEWKDGKRHGTGDFSDDEHGCFYRGEWQDDMREGKGRCVYFYDKANPVSDGYWHKDKFIG